MPASFVIVPCPHEATASYGRGTKKGPAAIIKALPYVENFDEERERVMVPAGSLEIGRPVPLAKLASRVAGLIEEGKIPVILGGEHSLTPVAVGPFIRKFKRLSVLQLDAHADLRNSYQDKKNSHACALRRVLEICPAVQVGIRSLSVEEWEWAKKTGQLGKMHFAPKLAETEKIVRQLSRDVYITIDVDVFDPAVIPATGTPEPGGLFWYEVLDILKAVCAAKKIVGFDVVELAPRKGETVSDFTAAKLIYKLMGFITE
ncbi:MAG: agmatinase [Candidatus Saganbacteria bacterium]|nr:agmatinase [Candidatus Saganbacteria bacterium]